MIPSFIFVHARRLGCILLGLCLCLSGCNSGSAVDESTRDGDADRVINLSDLCPDTPAGETVDADGCGPSQLDADQDGVSDALDVCAETEAGLEVQADGCTRVFVWRVEADPFVTLFSVPIASEYDLTSKGSFQQARYDVDALASTVALIGELGGLLGDGGTGDGSGDDGGDTGGGGGGEEPTFEVEALEGAVHMDENTALLLITFSGIEELPFGGTLSLSVLYSAFDVVYEEGRATWTFDVTVTLLFNAIIPIVERHIVGTATGDVSADGATITWTSIAGTLTETESLSGGAEDITPLEELFVGDEANPEAGLLPAWTLAVD